MPQEDKGGYFNHDFGFIQFDYDGFGYGDGYGSGLGNKQGNGSGSGSGHGNGKDNGEGDSRSIVIEFNIKM